MCSSHFPVCDNGYSSHRITHHHICVGDYVYFCYAWNRILLLCTVAWYAIMVHIVVSAHIVFVYHMEFG
jgi:hypothetical protein